jgi:hypothetical protein
VITRSFDESIVVPGSPALERRHLVEAGPVGRLAPAAPELEDRSDFDGHVDAAASEPNRGPVLPAGAAEDEPPATAVTAMAITASSALRKRYADRYLSEARRLRSLVAGYREGPGT